LVVVGAADAGELAGILGRHGRSSVLVIRNRPDGSGGLSQGA
jgi:hypothetical protein